MDIDENLLSRIKSLTNEDPSLGYRALHARLKEDPEHQQLGLKKVQSALQKLRTEDAPDSSQNTADDKSYIFSPEERKVFSASDDGTVREWSHQGELLRTFFSAGGAQCVDVTEDHIIAGDSAGMIRIWSRSSGDLVREIRVARVEHKYVKALTVTDGHFVTGDYCNMVQQWNLHSGQRELVCNGHTAGVVCVSVAGDYIVTGGGNGLVLLFDRRSAGGSGYAQSDERVVEPVANIYRTNGFVCSLEVTGQEVLIPDRDNSKAVSIRLFDGKGQLLPEDKRIMSTYKCGSVSPWQASRSGPFVFVLCTDFTLKKFSAKSHALLSSMNIDPLEPEKAKNPYCLKISGDRCYVGYINHREICAFSLNDGQRQAEGGFVGHQGTVNSFCIDRLGA
eukprot:TRINITY_DN90047_c0_g1_i1.p1 TRINITY_DN90047_c0_g1~~TRINITY_DN90047_c0_g1_i1.p1  ORF type:complete len:392 (+),score=55.44 TRINITY_DN90047_c0_g1_i1:49-1224(+)